MTILITCFILYLIQLSIHFLLRNDNKNFNVNNYFLFAQKEVNEERITESNKEETTNILTENTEDNKQILLGKSLKHLEFISEFEMYLEEKNYKRFPLDCLQELDKIKTEAQLSILKNSNKLKDDIGRVA